MELPSLAEVLSLEVPELEVQHLKKTDHVEPLEKLKHLKQHHVRQLKASLPHLVKNELLPPPAPSSCSSS